MNCSFACLIMSLDFSYFLFFFDIFIFYLCDVRNEAAVII